MGRKTAAPPAVSMGMQPNNGRRLGATLAALPWQPLSSSFLNLGQNAFCQLMFSQQACHKESTEWAGANLSYRNSHQETVHVEECEQTFCFFKKEETNKQKSTNKQKERREKETKQRSPSYEPHKIWMHTILSLKVFFFFFFCIFNVNFWSQLKSSFCMPHVPVNSPFWHILVMCSFIYLSFFSFFLGIKHT